MNRIVIVVVGTLMLAVAWSLPAAAADDQNCSYLLIPVSRAGSVTSAVLGLIGCYDTYEEAIEAGTDGAVDVPSGTTPETLSAIDITPASAASDVLIGSEYYGTGYGGSSTNYFAPVTCSASKTWEVNYVGDAHNDAFTSGKGFGGCDHNKKFVAADFGGNVLTCTPNCSDYGSLSNEVSSLRWKP